MSDEGLLSEENLEFLNKIRSHLRARSGLIAISFIAGLIIGIPISAEIIGWLISDAGLLPPGTSVITLTPVEFILMQVKVGAWLGVTLVVMILAIEGSWRAQLATQIPRPGRTILLTTISVFLLAISGVWYAFELLTPMLLDYLSADAQSAGLSTEWRLNGFVGFILNLCVACAIGFQAPVVTLLTIRSGAVERDNIIAYRRHIWFTTFIAGAALSPPDPLSLFLVSLPIILLFEIALQIDRIIG